jgi:hypothetical protein
MNCGGGGGGDVCAVQETRWKGEAAKFVGAKGRRYKLW